jgi:protein-S-isoprenylcysteine O-methyltransferase Ste14
MFGPLFQDKWQIIVGLSLLALFAVRIVSHFRAKTWEKGKTVFGPIFIIQMALTLPALIGVLLFVFYEPAVAWAALSFPEWLRYVGLVLIAIAAVFLAWIQYTLGANFSPLVRIKRDQQPIIAGPYRWVRHPMYSAIAMLSISLLLMKANWFIGAAWLLCTGLVMFARTPGEERVLLDAFGDQYRDYMSSTPRFVPNGSPVPERKRAADVPGASAARAQAVFSSPLNGSSSNKEKQL